MHEHMAVPGNVPLPLHQEMDVLDATVVGVVQAFGKVLLQVGLKVLLRFLTLSQMEKNLEEEFPLWLTWEAFFHDKINYVKILYETGQLDKKKVNIKNRHTVRFATRAFGSSENDQPL